MDSFHKQYRIINIILNNHRKISEIKSTVLNSFGDNYLATYKQKKKNLIILI